MRRSILMAVLALTVCGPPARAYTIPGFDNLVPGLNHTEGWLYEANGSSSHYGGATWSGFTSIVDRNLYNANYANSVVFPSPLVSATNEGSLSLSVYLDAPSDNFIAEFATWAVFDQFYTISARSITVTGYFGNELVASESLDLQTFFQSFDLQSSTDFDRVVITTPANPDGSSFWLMDIPEQDIPEPAGVAMLGIGLAAVAAARRRNGAAA